MEQHELDHLKQKAEQYRIRLEQLQTQRQDIDRQLIILEEQHKQYLEKIENSFGTTDPEELHKIASGYLIDIDKLEAQLQL